MTTDPDAEFPATPEPTAARMPVAAAIALDIIDEIAANTAVGVRIAVRVAPGAVKSVLGTVLRPVRQLFGGDGAQRRDPPNSGTDGSSPRTRLNAPITARRSVAFAALAMNDLRTIADAFDVTINDVFLTATTSAMRRWLQVHDTVPEKPLRTLMPISTRGTNDEASNSWSPAVVKLPVYLADPVKQLASIRDATLQIKNRRQAAPPVNLGDVIDLVPPVIIGQAAGLYTGLKLSRFHPPLAHVITSNVAGPPEEIYCAGAHILTLYPLAPLCEGANLNITAVSYGDTLAVGIVACPDNVDDVTSIARSIEDVAVDLKRAAEQKTGRRAGITGKPPTSGSKSTATMQFVPLKKRASDKKPTPSTNGQRKEWIGN